MEANRLAQETSPYLLQHAHNPVDWFPWGEEALKKSKAEDKPILLSIGYSACHWCHVMERESFEDEEIAELMNELFVPIKVDREERPDVDEIYMNAVQMMTGSGGWPLTVFLTPELKPFYGGTYFPPDDRWGRPGFKTVLTEIRRVYDAERERVDQSSEMLTERLQSLASSRPSSELLDRDPIRNARRELAARFDGREGGFSPAPKFPPSGGLALLLRYHHHTGDAEALAMAELTLSKMADGGIYDHLGGGFHRYSTDEYWLVPHFEKMLYDNALLAPVYLEAHQLTEKARYAEVARETLDWVLREMQGEEGGYYSTLDADSEGEEGKFYVFRLEEIESLLDEESAKRFALAYDVSPSGNWEGHTILHRPRPLEAVAEELGMALPELSRSLDQARLRLLAQRDQRVLPGLDDKILTSWNGLMLIAMCRGHRVLGEERFLDSARRAARFLLNRLVEDGRLLATYRDGRAKLKAYLDDHAFLLAGLVELYESDFDVEWLDAASQLADRLQELFLDESAGGFFFTGSDHEKLITRTKTGYDGAIPSGNAMAATYLLKLAVYTGSETHARLGVDSLRAFYDQLRRAPSGFAQMLMALDFYLTDRREVALVGSGGSEKTRRALERVWRHFNPTTAIALLDTDQPAEVTAEVASKVPLLRDKKAGDDPSSPLFYLCQNYACQAPTADLAAIEAALTGRT